MQKQNRISIVYWLILAAAAVLYALLALSDNIWADEAYTFAMLRRSFPEIWKITAADVHPPLYYFAAKVGTMAFNYSEYAVRAFSAVCCLLVIAIGGWQITHFFDRKKGMLFMILFALYPFVMDHAVEARMYPLAELCIFLNALFAYRVWQKSSVGNWIGFTAAGLCAAYTHYFALVSAAAIYGLLFLCIVFRKRNLLRPWVIVALVTILLYVPWLRNLIAQIAYKAENEYWIGSIGLSTMVDYAEELLHANGSAMLPLFFGLLVLWLLVRTCFRHEGIPLLAVLVCVLTAAVGIGASLLMRPVFIIRYLVPCGALLVFFLAWGLGEIKKDTLYGAAVGVLTVGFLGNAVSAGLDLIPAENQFNGAVAQQTSEAQAYVCLSEDAYHLHQIAAYYNPDVPIYTTETMGDASPYTNVYDIDDFSEDDYDTVLVFTDEGVRPADHFPRGYQATLYGTYQASYFAFDIWMLEKTAD